MSQIKEDITMGGFGSHGYGGGYDGYGGGGSGIWVFAILIVFVILALAFRGRDGHGYDGGGHFGGFGGCACPPVCKPVEDVAVAGIAKEVAVMAGQIKTQNAMDTGAIIHALDQQTCDIKIGEAAIIGKIKEAELANAISMRDMKIADQRDKILALEGYAMHEKTMQALAAQTAATNAHISSVQCELNHRLDFIPTKQPVFAASVTPCTTPVSFPFGGFDRDRDDRRGCCC